MLTMLVVARVLVEHLVVHLVVHPLFRVHIVHHAARILGDEVVVELERGFGEGVWLESEGLLGIFWLEHLSLGRVLLLAALAILLTSRVVHLVFVLLLLGGVLRTVLGDSTRRCLLFDLVHFLIKLRFLL